MIRELCDPYTAGTKRDSPWLMARRFVGRYKRRILASFEPERSSTSGPVIGFTSAAQGGLSKRALVSYIARPFYMGADELKQGNSNRLQSVEIARAFNRLGYVVDVVDYLDRAFVPAGHYDVFFGMGNNFERFLPYMDAETIKIYYATGAYWEFENAAENARCENLKVRRGITIRLPRRMTENTWVQAADAVIVIGNEHVVSGYRPHNAAVFGIDNSAHLTIPPDLHRKDFAFARRNFLWFGSVGLLHKGLDLALDVFSELEDLHLWVCGPLESDAEWDFVRAYRPELFHRSNIHPVGWTNIYSDQFRELVDKCACLVSASCSEGMSGGVLDCMGQGIIPLVSRESGIDTGGGLGIAFAESTTSGIRQVVTEMASSPPDVCQAMAEEAFRQASTRYSIQSFTRNIEQILRTIVATPGSLRSTTAVEASPQACSN